MRFTAPNLMRLVLCAFLILGPMGCQAISSIGDVARQYKELKPKIDATIANGAEILEQGNLIYEQGKETVAEVKDLHQASFTTADKNSDGKLSLSEMAMYGALMASGATEIARRKLAARQRAKNGVLHERINKVNGGGATT